ncbi:MAG: hypothetical protein J5I93_02630 [Pirellulaceae bacterium]|nr:hypothetical protein [Pirellulaceae bacterium]
MRRLSFRQESWKLLLVMICFALFGSGLSMMFDAEKRGLMVSGITVLSLVLGGYFHLQPVALRRRFLNRLGKRPADRREVLVLPLSQSPDVLPRNVELSGRLNDDLATLAEAKRQASLQGQRAQFWSWEQALRGIQHHLAGGGPLRRVILLASPESAVQLHLFVDQVIRRYDELKQVSFEAYYHYDGKLHVLDSPGYEHHRQNGVDFEDFDGLTKAFDRILACLESDGERHEQIQVDFTAGQKPASVVAAVVTICSDVANQYVSTNPRDRNADVWVYDVWGYDFWELRQPGS